MPRPSESALRLPIETREGTFVAYYSKTGLARLDFPRARSASSRPVPAKTPPPRDVVGASVQRWHKLAWRAIEEVLSGRQPRMLPPLDCSAGTDFQQRVWSELQKIPAGTTLTYGDVAARLGQPGAARAVGGACGANPIPLLIPCHRVLAFNRKIGGFSGGLEWKRSLLKREGHDL